MVIIIQENGERCMTFINFALIHAQLHDTFAVEERFTYGILLHLAVVTKLKISAIILNSSG